MSLYNLKMRAYAVLFGAFAALMFAGMAVNAWNFALGRSVGIPAEVMIALAAGGAAAMVLIREYAVRREALAGRAT